MGLLKGVIVASTAMLLFPHMTNALYSKERRGHYLANVDSIQEGHSREKVISEIGPPSFTSTFYGNEDKWYYHQYTRESVTIIGKRNVGYKLLIVSFSRVGKVMKVEFSPVHAKYYKTPLKYHKEEPIEYGKKLSFLEQLIGNLRKIAKEGFRK